MGWLTRVPNRNLGGWGGREGLPCAPPHKTSPHHTSLFPLHTKVVPIIQKLIANYGFTPDAITTTLLGYVAQNKNARWAGCATTTPPPTTGLARAAWGRRRRPTRLLIPVGACLG